MKFSTGLLVGTAVGALGGSAATVRAALKNSDIKEALFTTLVDKITGLIEERPSLPNPSLTPRGYIRYNNGYSRSGTYPNYSNRNVVRNPRSLGASAVLSTREEAEEVFSRLKSMFEEYEFIRVSDFYNMVNIPTSHVDDMYGWYSLDGNGDIVRTRRGYELSLPTPQLIG